MDRIRDERRTIAVALNFCTQNQLRNFKLVEKQYFTKTMLQGRIGNNKKSFLFYGIRNFCYDIVGYLISEGCFLSDGEYRDMILCSGI